MTVTFFLTWSINSCMAHMYMWWISTLQRQQPIYFSSHFCCSDRMHGTLALAQPPGPPHIYSQINVVDESHSSSSTALLPLTRPSPSLTWDSDRCMEICGGTAIATTTVRWIIHQPLVHVEIPGQFAHSFAPHSVRWKHALNLSLWSYHSMRGLPPNPCINSHSEDRLVACIHQSWGHDPIWVIFTTATSTYLIPVG